MAEIVHLFIFDSLADWEHGYAVAGICDPENQREPGRYAVRTVSPGGKTITSTGGIRMEADMALADVDPATSAMLILAGGAAWDQGKHTDAVQLAARFLEQGKPVAAICGATAALARGGLLDTRRHTSNALEYIVHSGYKGASLYQEEAVVDDGNVITASSMAALEFARAIFQRLDLYPPAVLDAWYGLFSTRRPEYFHALVAASHGA